MNQFLLNYDAAELKTASEFLSNWLPFLSAGLCNSCTRVLSNRIRSLATERNNSAVSTPVIDEEDRKKLKEEGTNCSSCSVRSVDNNNNNGNGNGNENDNDNADTYSLGSWKDDGEGGGLGELGVGASSSSEVVVTRSSAGILPTPQLKKSWADIALEDELAEEEESEYNRKVVNGNDYSEDGGSVDKVRPKETLSREQRERIRFSNVGRQKDLICLERVNGKHVNILEGLELHTGVFSAAEQKRIVSCVEELREKGIKGLLKARTYTAPTKWMRGKGRVTLQFGCCYNYAVDKHGNPPGILKNELVDPLPNFFKVMIKRLVRWHVLPPSCVPDSCIVNIYEEGDCIPPHIDNHEFVRPFCTVSFLSECKILFGSNLKIVGPGEFDGPYELPLPLGSVLVLNGNGADIAKHCVPAVPTKRISITFRKMDESKWPVGHVPEPDLQDIEPLSEEGDISTKSIGSGQRRSPRTPNSVGSRVDRGRGFNPRHSDSRYSDTRHSDSRHSDTRHSDSRHSDTRHSDTRHSDTRHSDSRHSDTRHSDTRHHSDSRHSDARHHSDTRHSDNRHSDSRHSDGSHSDDRHSADNRYSENRFSGRGRRASIESGRLRVNVENY